MSEHRTDAQEEGGAARGSGMAARERHGAGDGVYLRTVYPLNPGIPHYLDFPAGTTGD